VSFPVDNCPPTVSIIMIIKEIAGHPWPVRGGHLL
jgi:hypothetical protein